ncbi:MAG: hypothetical protein E6K58_05610 [Nitrospirae bacterium]|nr:MAG: hypothetical protein AUH21_02825 [Nitrospirae bacterium 13_2_20CM_62_7]OLB56726.1 MAG: hypothetical protein AUI03_03130 [Nitrospirae bacterium 13_2_20CM_2_62_8]TLY43251.1 MAG: hypothetical protein E6K58_05610 [Nitrospirota bacterium]
MRNSIECTEKKLDQIYPYVLQAAAPVPAFEVGLHYLSTDRVKILEADDQTIVAEVFDDSSSFQQRIFLENGSLITECSCSSPELPFCPHCVAALLAFQRQVTAAGQPFIAEETTDMKPVEGDGPVPASTSPLRELALFMEWLHVAGKALQSNEALPEQPGLNPGELKSITESIQMLHHHSQRNSERQVALESELATRDKQLESSVQDVKELQAVCEGLRQDVTSLRSLLARIARERDQSAEHLTSLVDDLILKKQSELESLTTSRHGISTALEALTPIDSQLLLEATAG